MLSSNWIICFNHQEYPYKAFAYYFSKVGAENDFFTNLVNITKWTKLTNFIQLLIRILLGFFALIIGGLALKEYQSQDTITAVNIEKNGSMALPAGTICLPLYFGELDELPHRTKIKYSLNEFSSNRNLTIDNFLPDYTRWHNIVRNVVHAYLIQILNCAYGYRCNSSLIIDKDLALAMDTLEAILLKLNISTDELRQRFGVEVAVLYSLNVSVHHLDSGNEDIDFSRTTFIDENQICYETQFNLYPFRISDYIKIRALERSLPSPQSSGLNRDIIKVYFAKRFFKFDHASELLIPSYFGSLTLYKIDLVEYRILPQINNGEVRCNEQPLEECETVCRINFIQKECKCMSTLWPSLQKHVKNVSFTL